MKCEEAQELITALIDDELSDLERASIDSHLGECVKCQFSYQQEQALKRASRTAAASITAPADLREKILSGIRALPESDRSPKRREWLGWLSPLAFRPAFVFALVFLLALPVIYLIRPKEPSIPRFALESHSKIMEGTLAYAKEESEEKLKEKLIYAVEGSFAPMGYDLSMMGLRPVGGMVQEIGGRKVLVAIYEGKAPLLTCYTFVGMGRDIPPEATLFVDQEKKINFYTFSHEGVNGVIHREGRLICILVSKLPMVELLALASSKAQPSPSF